MNSLRIALLASCLAVPAFAQAPGPRVPRIDPAAGASVNANATAVAQQNTYPPANPQASAHGQTETVPRKMPPTIDPVSPDKALTAKERAGLTVARRWIGRFQVPHLDADGVLHFTPGHGQIQVVTAVDHITDIALGAGEIVSPPLHIGDPDEWKLHPATAGSGHKTVTHILVKPSDAGLSTNIVLETNKRTLSIALTSRRADYMPLVALDLPQDMDAEWSTASNGIAGGGNIGAPAMSSPCDQPPVIPPDQFKISGDDVAWRPIQVYVVSTPVGEKTCIDFPSSIGSQTLPALAALADDGGLFSAPSKQIVNVRFVHRRFIADERLSRFVLIDGVGDDQKKIKVVRRQQ